ncbi:MAG: hypothetical protein ACJ75J_12685 [Cytophagaceae bacterium]
MDRIIDTSEFNQLKTHPAGDIAIKNKCLSWLLVSIGFTMLFFALLISELKRDASDREIYDMLFMYFILSFIGFWMVFSTVHFFDRKPQIIINKKGISFAPHYLKLRELIKKNASYKEFAWIDILGTYIKETDSGDSVYYSLIIKVKDDEMNINLSGIDIDHNDIAKYIEYFKNKSLET